jgi:hypothetical protein
MSENREGRALKTAMEQRMDLAEKLAPDFPWHPRDIFEALHMMSLDGEHGARSFLLTCQRRGLDLKQYARECAFGAP